LQLAALQPKVEHPSLEMAPMVKIFSILFSVLFVMFVSGAAKADCCNYGCCDCGCIALKAQKNASSIAQSIQSKLGKGGSVKSFSVSVDGSKPGKAKWVCTAAQNGATCSQQQ
jgi:hypothetical protein